MNATRFFLPLQNPIGFGAADFIELVFATVLLGLLLTSRSRLVTYVRTLSRSGLWSMVTLFVLPVVLRLALLAHCPIPTPAVSDDFSYVLLADTLRHWRLANPPHPLPQFFETFFVLQEPTYSSIFPLGQGLILAIGWTLFGHPWAGVAISIGAFCALCYWMLRAWVTPEWAFIGGLLAVLEFGPLNQWMNSFWGGAVSASAGCLVFGALPRLRAGGRARDAILLGLGLGIQLLTRPYESLFLLLSVFVFLLDKPPACQAQAGGLRNRLQLMLVTVIVVIPTLALTLLQNKRVTGSWTTLPYMQSRYQYGVPATFTWQPNPVPHRELTPQQQLDFQLQSQIHGSGTDTLSTYWSRLGRRMHYYRFFFLAPLYLALPGFLLAVRERRFLWVAGTVLLFALGTNFYPYFYSHYIAAITCLFILISVTALEILGRLGKLLLFLCAAHFLLWYGIYLFGGQTVILAMSRYETWDAINRGDPEGRIAIRTELEKAPGKQLIFVRYAPQHQFNEWIHNGADIDSSRIVWARDLGAEEDEKLRRYYPDRTVWLVEPDVRPPRLTRISPVITAPRL